MAEENNPNEEPQEGALNEKIVEAIVVVPERVIGDAVPGSFAVTLEALAHSLSLIMHNAGTAQIAGSQTANASVVSACAAILKAAK